MEATRFGGKLIAAIIFCAAFLFQIVGLIRYVDRLPDDVVGIGLYVATIVGLAIVAVMIFVQSRKERRMS